MAHFKRKGPKSTHCGCMLCKGYKRQGAKLPERARHSGRRRMAAASESFKAEGLDRFDPGIR
jgi:hypothetical protein